MKVLMALAKIVGAAGFTISLLATILWSSNILEFIVYGLLALTHAVIVFITYEMENTWVD